VLNVTVPVVPVADEPVMTEIAPDVPVPGDPVLNTMFPLTALFPTLPETTVMEPVAVPVGGAVPLAITIGPPTAAVTEPPSPP
jgi:hypothetical protein